MSIKHFVYASVATSAIGLVLLVARAFGILWSRSEAQTETESPAEAGHFLFLRTFDLRSSALVSESNPEKNKGCG